MKLPPETIERLLDRWPVARLATLGPGGRPHQVPIVFARADGLLWSPVDAKPKAAGELARVRNLRANPSAGLLLDHYDADWSRLWWLRVDATARVVRLADPDASPETDPTTAAPVAALREKYPQYATLPVLRDPPTLLELTPVAVASWCARRDSAPVC